MNHVVLPVGSLVKAQTLDGIGSSPTSLQLDPVTPACVCVLVHVTIKG